MLGSQYGMLPNADVSPLCVVLMCFSRHLCFVARHELVIELIMNFHDREYYNMIRESQEKLTRKLNGGDHGFHPRASVFPGNRWCSTS